MSTEVKVDKGGTRKGAIRGPYKNTKSELKKKLLENGIDPETLKPIEKKVESNKTEDNGQVEIPNVEVPPATYSTDQIRQIIAAQKLKSSISSSGGRNTESEATKPDYVDLRTEEEKKQDQEAQQKQQQTQQQQEKQTQAEKLKAMFNGLDGNVLLMAMNQLNKKIIPPVCKRFNKKVPPANKIAYSELELELMKPGADELMVGIFEKIDSPVKLMAFIAVSHIVAIIMFAPKEVEEAQIIQENVGNNS